jgi:hypothetical protein
MTETTPVTSKALRQVEEEHPELSDAEKYRMAQAQTLLDGFERHHGRPARSTDELEEWSKAGSPGLAEFLVAEGALDH